MRIVSQRNLVWSTLAAFAVVLAAGQPADASFTMRLTDLITGEEVIVVDDGVAGTVSDCGYVATSADMAGTTDGSVVYLGDVGTFHFSMTTGVSDPIIGSASRKRLNTVSLVVSGGEGLLQIELTDTDFAFPRISGKVHLTSSIGGTTDGIVTAQSYADLLNQEFGTGITSGLQGGFGSALNGLGYDKSFSGFTKTTFDLDPQQEFSLTQQVTVEHFNTGDDATTSFGIITEVHTPEPATIAMWGIGLACAGFYSWRRRRQRGTR